MCMRTYTLPVIKRWVNARMAGGDDFFLAWLMTEGVFCVRARTDGDFPEGLGIFAGMRGRKRASGVSIFRKGLEGRGGGHSSILSYCV